jgi:hypothetical protein
MPELISKWFWAFFAAMALANTTILWVRSRRDVAAHPERSASYDRLILGYAVAVSVPWLVAGGVLLAGEADGFLDFVRPASARPAVQLWHGLLVGMWALLLYWLFARRGAEQLAAHPALLNRTCLTAEALKLWLTLGVVGGVIAEIAMWSGFVPLPAAPL